MASLKGACSFTIASHSAYSTASCHHSIFKQNQLQNNPLEDNRNGRMPLKAPVEKLSLPPSTFYES
jgi:hypothetical protein